MKLLRLQISGQLLAVLGRDALFDDLEWFEVLNAYQYDQQNFFSLQRYKFRPASAAAADLATFLGRAFNTISHQVVERTGTEYVCFVKQDLKNPFFSVLEPGPWAVVFPVLVTPDRILLTLIAMETEIPRLLQTLSRFTDSYKVIAISTLKGQARTLSVDADQALVPSPTFTTRQRAIAQFAVNHGYYRAPREISAQEVADHFEISESAVNAHLRKVEALAVEFFFGQP